MKSWSSFIASNSVSTIKICRKKNSAGSFGFSKIKENGNAYQPKEKTVKEKPLLHGFVSFHVAAVFTVVIQLKIRTINWKLSISLCAVSNGQHNAY